MRNNHSNLIPFGSSRRLLVWTLVRSWAVTLGLAALLTATASVYWRSEEIKCKRRIAELRNETDDCKALCEESERLVSEVSRLKEQWRDFSSLSNVDVPGALLAKLSHAMQPFVNRVRLNSIVIRQAKVSGADDAVHDEVIVDISGLARDTVTIGQLLGSIREVELIDHAELISTQEHMSGASMMRAFQIQAKTSVAPFRKLPMEEVQ